MTVSSPMLTGVSGPLRVRWHGILVVSIASLAFTQCRGSMTDEKAVVTWSVSGLPPSYTEQRRRAEVPATLRHGFEALLTRSRFFDLPADAGPNNPDARDAGTYSITVTIGSRTHTVRFSDSSTTQELADLRNWVRDNLGASATPE
jgi:hypothetical protein